ncbi:MAG: hypothetical protein SLRJCFUN_002080 [Candidatus Fervidibacter sp.]
MLTALLTVTTLAIPMVVLCKDALKLDLIRT